MQREGIYPAGVGEEPTDEFWHLDPDPRDVVLRNLAHVSVLR